MSGIQRVLDLFAETPRDERQEITVAEALAAYVEGIDDD